MACWAEREVGTEAVRRAQKMLSVSSAEARRVVRASYAAQAACEAESLYFIRHNREIRSYLPGAFELPAVPRPIVFVLMETGAEDFAYAFLRKICRLDARAIRAAPVAARHPRRWFDDLRRRWLWIQLGVDLLGTDDASLHDASRHLEREGALVVSYGLLGDRSPVLPMLRSARSRVVPMAVLRSPTGFRAAFGTQSAPTAIDPLHSIHDQMAAFVRRWPDHWTGWSEAARAAALVPRRLPLPLAARV